MKNFRINTDYQLEIYNSTTQEYYLFWIGLNGNIPFIEISDTPSRATELSGSYWKQGLPIPPETATNSNYRLKNGNLLQLKYPKDQNNSLWYTICVDGNADNPTIIIENNGEE